MTAGGFNVYTSC